jgi:glutathione synthase/RimK-type ligase-like ATP-grasp enzyme
MKRIDVAIATCLELPEPDDDEALLGDALRGAGIHAQLLAWDDPQANFADATLTLIRSTWNYWQAHDAFVAWIERTAAVSILRNPPEIVRWNLHKKYLLDLAQRGIPTIPTRIFARGETVSLAAVARDLGADQVVIKPAVSAASSGTMRTRALKAEGEDHLQALLKTGDVIVQPYVPSVEGYGERAVVCIDGEPSHAVRKSPRFQGDQQNVSDAMPIADDERVLAKKVLATLPTRVMYARVDIVRDRDEAPVVMELEVTEPSLFFSQSPDGLARFVKAIARCLAEAK